MTVSMASSSDEHDFCSWALFLIEENAIEMPFEYTVEYVNTASAFSFTLTCFLDARGYRWQTAVWLHPPSCAGLLDWWLGRGEGCLLLTSAWLWDRAERERDINNSSHGLYYRMSSDLLWPCCSWTLWDIEWSHVDILHQSRHSCETWSERDKSHHCVLEVDFNFICIL